MIPEYPYSLLFQNDVPPLSLTVTTLDDETTLPDGFAALGPVYEMTPEGTTFGFDVLRLDDVTAGSIDGVTVPVDIYRKINDGMYRVIQNIPELEGVSGSGYLVKLHFHVTRDVNDICDIRLSNGILGNTRAEKIVAEWQGASIVIGTGTCDDANGDGAIIVPDMTSIERIIHELENPTYGADANADREINALDITEVCNMILEINES